MSRVSKACFVITRQDVGREAMFPDVGLELEREVENLHRRAAKATEILRGGRCYRSLSRTMANLIEDAIKELGGSES